MDRLHDVGPRDAGLREQRIEAGQARLRGVGIRREPLAGGDLAGGRLEDEVREGSAHVEPDAIGHQRIRDGGSAAGGPKPHQAGTVSSGAPRTRARCGTGNGGRSAT